MRNLYSVLAATAIAAGVLTLSGTAAFADEKIPEKTIKSECKAAGGQYDTTVEGKNRHSSCQYRDVDGEFFVDLFKNGKFTGTF